ncbi:hypothetical protein NMB32_19550 [Stenotrophomonas sp. CD2]|nr:hypothetical protein NMB32_19550 [Stenotrophomonas sp. CD2]
MRIHRCHRWPAPVGRLLLLCLLAMVIPACSATAGSADARLRDAAARGDAEAVRGALEDGADLEARDGRVVPRCCWPRMATM